MVTVHGLAASAVVLTTLPAVAQSGLLLLLTLSMARQGRLYRRFPAGQDIQTLSVDTQSTVWIERDGYEAQPGELYNAWLGPGIGVASIRSGEKMYRVLWLSDSADAQALRRWRVWLRWAASNDHGGPRRPGS